jgi:hypothetical protein
LDKKKLPVILITDNHPSHFSVEISKKCEELGIILVSLFPNSTFISQPLDCAVFAHVKDLWEKLIDDERLYVPNFRINLENFGILLEKVSKESVIKSIIERGFRITGLYPFNVEAIPFSKLHTKRNRRSTLPVVIENNKMNIGFCAYTEEASESEVSADFNEPFEIESCGNKDGQISFYPEEYELENLAQLPQIMEQSPSTEDSEDPSVSTDQMNIELETLHFANNDHSRSSMKNEDQFDNFDATTFDHYYSTSTRIIGEKNENSTSCALYEVISIFMFFFF